MVIRSLLKPKLWITLASLAFITVALVHQGEQLRQINLEPRGWWLLLLGLGVTWLSILVNGLAWRLLLDWLGQRPPGVALVPLFVRSNLLKYLPGGIWHLVERVRRLRPAIGAGPALAGVILDPLLIVAAASLLMLVGDGSTVCCCWRRSRPWCCCCRACGSRSAAAGTHQGCAVAGRGQRRSAGGWQWSRRRPGSLWPPRWCSC